MWNNPLLDGDDAKLYYSIGEVSELFDVNSSLIRFWESEFEVLKPSKNAKGERRFTRKDIEAFRVIYHLVKERGFTLEGAKNEIANHKSRLKQKMAIIDNLQRLKAHLQRQIEELDTASES